MNSGVNIFLIQYGLLSVTWYHSIDMLIHYTVGTPYDTNVAVQKIPDRAIWKPVVAKRNNTK